MHLLDLIINYLPSLIAALVVVLVGAIIYLVPCGVLLLVFWFISRFMPKDSFLNRRFKILAFTLQGKYWISLLLPLPVFGYIFILYVIQAFALLAR